jgi:hypothetical protein
MIGILSTIVKSLEEVMTNMYIVQKSRSIDFRKTKTPFRNSYFKIQMSQNVGVTQQLNNKSFDEKNINNKNVRNSFTNWLHITILEIINKTKKKIMREKFWW